MRSDIEIKRDVETELRRTPDIDATDIAGAVKNGIVTLTGFVHDGILRALDDMARKATA